MSVREVLLPSIHRRHGIYLLRINLDLRRPPLRAKTCRQVFLSKGPMPSLTLSPKSSPHSSVPWELSPEVRAGDTVVTAAVFLSLAVR